MIHPLTSRLHHFFYSTYITLHAPDISSPILFFIYSHPLLTLSDHFFQLFSACGAAQHVMAQPKYRQEG